MCIDLVKGDVDYWSGSRDESLGRECAHFGRSDGDSSCELRPVPVTECSKRISATAIELG